MSDPQPTDSHLVKIDTSIPGIRVYRSPSLGEGSLIVRSIKRRPDWRTYVEWQLGDETKLPGTTLVYKDAPYCIASAQESDGIWEYRLQPWPATGLMLQVTRLDAETIIQTDADAAEMTRIEMGMRVSVYHEAFIGCLPRRILETLEVRFHFSSEDASRKNAMVEFFFFLPFATVSLALGMVAGLGAICLSFLFWLFALEGLVRWAHVVSSNRAYGLLVLEIADALHQRFHARKPK